MSTPTAAQTSQVSPCEALLRAAEDNLVATRRAGAQRLVIAHAWALEHRTRLRTLSEDNPGDAPAGERHERKLGARELSVWEYAPAELAAVLEMHPVSAQRLMADAVDMADRLPHTWAAVQDLVLEAWVGRKIVALTRELSTEQAVLVDAQIAGELASLSTGRLLRLVEGRVVAADPDAAEARAEEAHKQRGVWFSRQTSGATDTTRGLAARLDARDAARLDETCDQLARLLANNNGTEQEPETFEQLRARALGLLADPQAAVDFLAGRDPRRGKAVVYVHTTPEQLSAITGTDVARVEDIGPVTARMLAQVLGHDHITLKPVIDLNDVVAADAYEIPTQIAERARLTRPFDYFPYAEALGTRFGDLDHITPYNHTGPPGQTSTANLAPLTRRHHRIKTHARGWHVQQHGPTSYLWTTPHGRQFLVDHHGTHKVHKVEQGIPRVDYIWSDDQITLAA